MHHVDLRIRSNWVRQGASVENWLAIDEHGNMLAQTILIIQNIAAQRLGVLKNFIERCAHCLPDRRPRRAVDVTLKVGGENDFGHWLAPAAERPSLVA